MRGASRDRRIVVLGEKCNQSIDNKLSDGEIAGFDFAVLEVQRLLIDDVLLHSPVNEPARSLGCPAVNISSIVCLHLISSLNSSTTHPKTKLARTVAGRVVTED